uniref:Uncharacterized protein n=1 Tax=Rhizophora mucronata TaxID=61149 RepID=A0A2P2QRA2_RHIMU
MPESPINYLPCSEFFFPQREQHGFVE